MIDGIGLALTSIKATKDTVKAAIELRDKGKVDEALQEINAKLLATQELMFAANQERGALLANVEELENKCMQFENWEREADRYTLKELPPRVLVYALKEPVQGTEPVHYICPNCYNDRKKSLLHRKPLAAGEDYLWCDNCNYKQRAGVSSDGAQQQVSDDYDPLEGF